MSVKVDASGFAKFRASLGNARVEQHIKSALNETVMTALGATKKATPVVTGTLRREWKVTPVMKEGAAYVASLYNDTKYAPYVEYGHRTNRKDGSHGWVEGQYMMTNACKQTQAVTSKIARKHIQAMLTEMGMK